MSRARIAAALCVSVALVSMCRRPPDVREARDFERMRQQQRYDSYEKSLFFSNGAVMQPPPEHSVPRDSMPVDEMARDVGERQFAISCAPCHGAGGFGGGPVAPNLAEKHPTSLRSSVVAALPDSQLFNVITDGFGRMPPYGWQMPPSVRRAVVGYVRSLGSQPSSPATRADSAMAAYLQRVDSLHAAGASLDSIPRPPSPATQR